MKSLLSSILAIVFVLGLSSSARAQGEVTLLSPNPIEETVKKLVADFETKTGTKVNVTFGTGVSTRKTVADGGALDVTLLFAPFDDALKTGNVDQKTATVVARMRLAIAVKKGASKPDISNAAAVKKALLSANSIISVDPAQGSVGGAALLALDKMGITDQVKPKIKWVQNGGIVQSSVANGEVEMTLGPYLSDMRNPGLDVVGALPPDAATPIDITGFIATNAKNPAAAKELLKYLSSHDIASVYEEAKLFPAH